MREATRRQIYTHAYRELRAAGLTTGAACRGAERVMERTALGETLEIVLREVVRAEAPSPEYARIAPLDPRD